MTKKEIVLWLKHNCYNYKTHRIDLTDLNLKGYIIDLSGTKIKGVIINEKKK